MSRIWTKNLTAAIRAPFWKKSGLKPVVANTANAGQIGEDWRRDNGFQVRWDNAAGTDCIRGTEVDTSNNLLMGEEAVTPMRKTVTFNLATAAELTAQCFFIADRAYRIVGITEIHGTAESTATTMTGYVEKLTSTTALGSGTTVQTGTFDLKGTAVTLQTGVLLSTGTGDSDDPTLQLAAGDRLGFAFSTAGTELAGLVVVVTLAPAGVGHTIVWSMKANANLADLYIFQATRDYIVTAAYYVHSTACSVASSAVMLKKATSTNGLTNGTALLTNNTNIGFACDGTANTVQTGTLTATAASLRLLAGDRLALDFTATLTALVGVVVVVTLQATAGRKEVTFAMDKTTNMVDQVFFTADRNYEILDAMACWSVLSSGGANVKLTRDTGTTAAGGGTNLTSNDTSAGFQIDGTANVPERATWVNTQLNFLMAGDRLALKWASAPTSLRGFVCTVSLAPR